jgi:hypothetical protein
MAIPWRMGVFRDSRSAKIYFLFGNCLREKIGSISEKFKEMGKI